MSNSLEIHYPELICVFCKKDCSRELKFNDSVMERWGLITPMCLPCAIEALVENKIKIVERI